MADDQIIVGVAADISDFTDGMDKSFAALAPADVLALARIRSVSVRLCAKCRRQT